MTAHRLCPRCGAPLAPGLTAATLRCPSCGEEVVMAAPPGRPAAAVRGAGDAAAEHAVRSSLRSRLGGIVEALDQVAKASTEVRALRDLVVGIRSEVTSGYGPNGEPLDWLGLSQQLSFAPRLLRRSGLDDLAAEVERVRAAIDRLATHAHRPRPTAARPEPSRPTTDAVPRRGEGVALSSATRGDGAARPRRRCWLLVVAALVVAAAAGVAWLAPSRRPAAEPVATPPTPLPTAVAHRPQPSQEEPPGELEQFSLHVADARAAVLGGEPRAAVRPLVAAAAIARDRAVLFDAAREAVIALTNAAQTAMNEGRWSDADSDLAAAVDLGAELELDTDEALAAALQRLSSTAWSTTVSRPGLAQLEALRGRQVVVATAHGGARGQVAAVTPTTLTLAAAASVAGGGLTTSSTVAVADIESVSFDAPIDARLTLAALDRAAARRSRPDLVATPRPPEATPER